MVFLITCIPSGATGSSRSSYHSHPNLCLIRKRANAATQPFQLFLPTHLIYSMIFFQKNFFTNIFPCTYSTSPSKKKFENFLQFFFFNFFNKFFFSKNFFTNISPPTYLTSPSKKIPLPPLVAMETRFGLNSVYRVPVIHY